MFTSTSNQQTIAKLSIVGLLAAFIVMMPLGHSPAKASGPTPNDGQCDLTTVSPNVFSISSALELWEVTDCVATGGGNNTFRLDDNIDVTGEADAPTSSPIGTSTSSVAFTGTLDGNNKSITGVSMSSALAGVGLFELLGNATISNLSISGTLSYTGSAGGPPNDVAVGMLAKRSNGTVHINSVSVSGSVKGFSFVGGLIGRSSATTQISESTMNATIIGGGSRVGGFIGQSLADVTFLDARNNGAVTGAGVDAGGAGVSAGGFVGLAGGASNPIMSISNSVNSGPILGNASNNVGGFIGCAGVCGGGSVTVLISIDNSRNYAPVHGESNNVGAFVGSLDAGSLSISNSVNQGTVSALVDDVGGFVGAALANTSLEIESSTNSNSVSGLNRVGGFVGSAGYIFKIVRSINQGDVEADGTSGGIIGRHSTGLLTLANAGNSGEIRADSGGGAGGLVGFLESAEMDVSNSFNEGLVTSSHVVSGTSGGFVGLMDGNSVLRIQDSYNSGNVHGQAQAAGFARGSVTSILAISRSYQIGTITGSQKDSIAVNASVTVNDFFTNQSPSSWSAVSSDAQMQQKSTYVDAGWNFDTVWGFVCGKSSFPVLRFANPTASADQCVPITSNDSGSGGTPAPAPTYTGPTLVSQAQPVAAGSSVTFTGSKLDVVTKAMIGTTEVQITSQTATSLTITVPATLAAATYDLVLFSSFGTLSVMGAITITGVQAESVSQAQLLGWSWTLRFQGNSRSLSPAQDSHLRARVLAQPDATTAICWGYTTASSPNAWAIAHATQRAQAACNLVAAANSEVKTVVRLRYGVEKSSAMRSAVQFWR